MLTRDECAARIKIFQAKPDEEKRKICLQIAATYPDCAERDKILKQAESYAKSTKP